MTLPRAWDPARWSGWRRLAGAALLGGLGALAQPPFCLLPLLLIALPGLMRLVESAPRLRDALKDGLCWYMGLYVAMLHWISAALLVPPADFAWAVPLAVLGIPLLLAPFGLVAVGLWWRFRPADPLAAWLAFTALCGASEWLRGHLFTGFPWGLAAYGWSFSAAFMQAGAWIGAYGVTLVTLLLAGLPWLWLRPGFAARRLVTGGLIALLPAWHLAGALRLTHGPDGDGPPVRIVQPDIGQAEKWDPARRQANFDQLLAQSLRPFGLSGRAPRIMVWPETAIEWAETDAAAWRRLLGQMLPADGWLLTGALRWTGDDSAANALVAMNGAGGTAIYDKHHLVPFGEYMPLDSWLGLGGLVFGAGGFVPGPGPAILAPDGLPPFAPLVCYEVIFPGQVAPPGDRPAFIVNVTNDAWYGNSIGPRQHFAMARWRAVEEGVPLLRAAGTGISGVVDGQGRVIASLQLGAPGVVDALMPPAAPPTFYARLGDAAFWTILLLLCIGAAPGIWRSGFSATVRA